MTVTIFGVLVVVMGCWLFVRGTTVALLAFVLLTTLLGGSAAIILGMGSSIPPAIIAVMMLAARCMLPSARPTGGLRASLGDNALLVLFALYGAVGAYILPLIFARRIDVTPLRPVPTNDPFVTYPLMFSPQNITVSLYLIATMLGSICAYVAVQRLNAERVVVRAAATVAIVHAMLGFVSVAVAGTGFAAVLSFFRNNTQKQLDQAIDGFARMNGIFAEPSAYAVHGFIFLVFMTELWLRGVEIRWTRPATILILAAMLASTSSTAYIGTAIYVVILCLRAVIFAGTVSVPKMLGIAAFGLLALIAILAILVARPELFEMITTIVAKMTVDKGDTRSAMVRLMWAQQGIWAFWISGGLGIGAGSFRSSSIATAILGSVGIIGTVAFVGHLTRVLQPLRHSTYLSTGDARIDTGAAAAWTATVMLIPLSVSAASPDPGLTWGMMCGMALALRAPRPSLNAPPKIVAADNHHEALISNNIRP